MTWSLGIDCELAGLAMFVAGANSSADARRRRSIKEWLPYLGRPDRFKRGRAKV